MDWLLFCKRVTQQPYALPTCTEIGCFQTRKSVCTSLVAAVQPFETERSGVEKGWTAAPLSLNDTRVRCSFSDGTPPGSYNPNCCADVFCYRTALYIWRHLSLLLLLYHTFCDKSTPSSNWQKNFPRMNYRMDIRGRSLNLQYRFFQALSCTSLNCTEFLGHCERSILCAFLGTLLRCPGRSLTVRCLYYPFTK